MANRPVLKLPISKIEPNKYNPNVMPENLFESLKESVKEGNYDPIVVSPKDIFYGDESLPRDEYVIVDGEHRWTAAKELEMDNVLAEVRDEKESEARGLSYKRNRERGTIDPIKEAQLFKLELDEGMNQSEIAEKYHISNAQVSERLKLLKLDEDTVKAFHKPKEYVVEKKKKQYEEDLKQFEELKEEYKEDYEESDIKHWEEQNKPEEPTPDTVEVATLTASHLEILASIDDDERRAQLRDAILERDYSVRETEAQANRIKEELEKEKQLKILIQNAERPTCPECGGEAKEFSTYNEGSLRCGDCWNWWDSTITEEEVEKRKEESKKREKMRKEAQTDSRVEAMKKARANPAYIRRLETPDEINEKIERWLTNLLLTKLHTVKDLELSALMTDEETWDKDDNPDYYRIIFSPGDNRLEVTKYVSQDEEDKSWWSRTRAERFDIDMEKKDYKRSDHKSRIDIGHEVSPLGRSLVHNFIDDILLTPGKAQWPWHNKEDIKGALESGVEEEEEPDDEEGELEAEIAEFEVETINLQKYVPIITAFIEGDDDKCEVTVEDHDPGDLRALLIGTVLEMDLEQEVSVEREDNKVMLTRIR